MGSTRLSPAPRLTPELIALVARRVEDTGPAAGVVVHNDEDYEASWNALQRVPDFAYELNR